MPIILIDGKSYDSETLPIGVLGQVAAMQQCDTKINSWNMDIAIAQTAKLSYAAELYLLLATATPVGNEKVEAEEVDEIDEVEILSAEEVEVLETEEIEANR